MTLDEVQSLKGEMEAAFKVPAQACFNLVQRRLDENQAGGFVRSLIDMPARYLPWVLASSTPMLVGAAHLDRRPRGNIAEAVFGAQGADDARPEPYLSVGYSAVGKKDYRAEVRIQDPDVRTVLLAQEIVHRANGQARVGRYRDLEAHAGKPAAGTAFPIGSSVGHRKCQPGTLGLYLRSDEGIGVVSNSHVMAWCGRAKLNDPIMAPHPDDSTQAREIGRLRRFSSLIHDDVIDLDLAFAVLDDGVPHGNNVVPPGLPDAGKSIKVGAPLPVEAIGLGVTKIGRSTRSTSGTLAAFNVGAKLSYKGLGEVKLTGMLEIQWPSSKKAFSAGGDSGSVVYRPDTMEAIGLVVGGGVREVDGKPEGVTIVCPLTAAMQAWGLSPP